MKHSLKLWKAIKGTNLLKVFQSKRTLNEQLTKYNNKEDENPDFGK